MKVPLLDLQAQHRSIKEEVEAAVLDVFSTQRFILGPQVEALESALASYCGDVHAVAVSSGTDALLMTLMAEGIGPGDEVITTPYTFFSTAGSIARTGATPVFVDIEPETFNIDPARVSERVTPQTRAIMPVHLFGQMADMDAIMEIATAHHLIVIEDAAQALGAENNGQRAGTVGDYGCFSFFPSKNLGGAGDGGLIVTRDEDKAARLRVLRVHGGKPKYHHQVIGGNFRLDAVQAAVLNVKLKYLDDWTAARQANAARYGTLFAEAGLLDDNRIRTPTVVTNRHVFNQYVIRAADRDALKHYLFEHETGCEIYYPIPLHLQKCFAHLRYRKGNFPESEHAANKTLALPVYPELTDEQITTVVNHIATFYRQHTQS